MPIVPFPTYPVTHVCNVTGFPPMEFTVEDPIGRWARGTIGSLTKTEEPGTTVRRTYQTTLVGPPGPPEGKTRVQQQYPYINRNPAGTDPRLICRTNFKSAVIAWKALSDPEKEVWNEAARTEYLPPEARPWNYKVHVGINLFISDYMP